MTASAPNIIVALDYARSEEALKLADRLSPELCRLKVGKELFTAAGPDFIRQLVAKNFSVFLDLKFHDIPTTVAKACLAAADLGVWMINVHCLGGRHMLEASAKALQDRGYSTHLIGVTVLTSMSSADCVEVGLSGNIPEQVSQLAQLAQQSGLAGVVCSAQEAPLLRKICGNEFLLVTPGIRDHATAQDDQQRVMTPKMAIDSGSDYLVIGRMITASPHPAEKLQQIMSSLAGN